MATAWIQVFILTFAECVAPAGKTVCQEQQFELQFLTKADCQYALEQLIAMKGEAEHVIVNRQKSRCAPTAVETDAYPSLDAINAAHSDTSGWLAPGENDIRRAAVSKDHNERLEQLMPCDETANVVPCRIGDIIVEDSTGDSVEIWKSD
ncbi:MAG: hypothetical protein GWP67_03445 [Gammaproteobacteria bacterium]|jgi:hypothetical protein|nr:hypothetical protein [Gammaproteobacteria bacterium]